MAAELSKGCSPEVLSGDVRSIFGAPGRPPLPGTLRTTSRTTPATIVSVMADELGRPQLPLRVSSCMRRSRRQPARRRRCGLAGEIPACAAPGSALAQPGEAVARGARRATSAVARGLAVRRGCCQSACQGACSAAWLLPDGLPGGLQCGVAVARRLARGLATGLPAGGRIPAGVGHRRTRTPSRVASQTMKSMRGMLGWDPVAASVLASAPEQAAHQHPRVREAAQS